MFHHKNENSHKFSKYHHSHWPSFLKSDVKNSAHTFKKYIGANFSFNHQRWRNHMKRVMDSTRARDMTQLVDLMLQVLPEILCRRSTAFSNSRIIWFFFSVAICFNVMSVTDVETSGSKSSTTQAPWQGAQRAILDPAVKHCYYQHLIKNTTTINEFPCYHRIKLTLWPPNYSIWIFTHLELCLADAIHNFKWVKIIQVDKMEVSSSQILLVDVTFYL